MIKLPLSEARTLSLYVWADMEVALLNTPVVESKLNLSKRKLICSSSLNIHVGVISF